MRVNFEKMHGLGNDFVMIDGISQPVELSEAQVRALGDRRRGVGFDQLLQAVPCEDAPSRVGVKIYNADGTAAGQCGNGMRCLALFLRGRGLVGPGAVEVGAPGGVIALHPLDDGRVRVRMGVPALDPQDVPFLAPERAPRYPLALAGGECTIAAVSIGNPHAVLAVEDVARAPVAALGAEIQACGRFPAGVNVGFCETVSREHLRLRVYERGVGETQACGSGACAAVVAGRLLDELDEVVRVDLPGGGLEVSWAGEGSPVWMTGPAARVFTGEAEL